MLAGRIEVGKVDPAEWTEEKQNKMQHQFELHSIEDNLPFKLLNPEMHQQLTTQVDVVHDTYGEQL